MGFEKACEELGVVAKCVFSSDIDKYARTSYEENFGEPPHGDITKIDEKEVPDHDVLFAGFPCQAFSIIGLKGGFEDTRGALFFDIARILKEKRPRAFILENVKQLVGHDRGRTLEIILRTLRDLGYFVQYKVLNALDFGLPQKRERVIIVGHQKNIGFEFPTPQPDYKPLADLLEKDEELDPRHFASDYIQNKRKSVHRPKYRPAVWHENKSGNISSYPYSCALRAGASYNYLLVNGERRLSPREMFRLQGFPDSYKIVVKDSQARKQAGNSVPVNIIKAVSLQLLPFLTGTEKAPPTALNGRATKGADCLTSEKNELKHK